MIEAEETVPVHRPWGEEKVPKQTEKLSTASVLLCFVRAQAWRIRALDPRDRDWDTV